MTVILDDRRPEGGPRLMMKGFSDEVNEVFHNLIDNAVKYGFAQTDITVTVSPVQDGHVGIAVGNNGEPIAKKHIDRLTERFYRVDKARSRKIGGTGLGLAIVKHIVNRHRGQLHISSSPEGITCFTVRLPVLDMPDSSDKPETGHKTVT